MWRFDLECVAAVGAVRHSDGGVEHPQVVRDVGHRSHDHGNAAGAIALIVPTVERGLEPIVF